MWISRIVRTAVDDDIVRQRESCHVRPFLRKATSVFVNSITIAHKFHPPLVGGNVEIRSSRFSYSGFRKGDNRAVETDTTAAGKFILLKGLQWALDSTMAHSAFSHQSLRRSL